ncbi:FecR family protein [Flavobacterium supellecticarium]|uniref:FecR family protein n=1 Tax=Flavobacterium supellecticarium TaxID=2565924 RepID=UPI001454E2A8|nr:FecR family protein [Flavobacterium supellecticarium]
MIPFKYIVSVAAAILLTMVISLFLIRYKRTPVINEINTHIVQEDILPGGNKATLILSNGKTINLDEQKQEIIIGDSSLNYGDGTTLATTVNVETAILKTPRAGQYDIVLPDGTKVSLNAESSLEYPVKFTGSERRVKLNGEGYFEVAHDKSKPFHVETKNQDVQVLGTVFNIQSYTEKEATTLFSGKVHVENTTTKKSATLTPGQNAVATSTSLNVQNIDLHDFAMWKKGRFGGSSKSLIEVLTEIERWYDIDIKMNKNISNSERAYISISRKENLSVVLDGIGQTYGVNFQIKGKEVIIQPK